MAEELHGTGRPAPNNVFQLDQYRTTRKTRGRRKNDEADSFEVEAHLYIDVCSDGETRFGVIGADVDNAICLLEPIFVLGRQLVRLATDEPHKGVRP